MGSRFIVFMLMLVLALGCAALVQAEDEVIDQPPSVPIWLNDVVVTLSTPTECYIEEPNRSTGIRVAGDCSGISMGDEVSVIGNLSILGGEKYVSNATVSRTDTVPAIKPLAMNNRNLGGAYNAAGLSIWDYVSHKIPGDGLDWQWTKAGGCPTVGLLVTTWGVVKDVFYSPTTGATWFHIDDGSRVTSDLGDTGVIVYSDAPVKKGQFVTIKGISGVEPAIDMPDKLVRVLRTRSVNDVLVWKEPKPLYPFSDEFDGEKLDWRWCGNYITSGKTPFSLSDSPDWLQVTLAPSNNYGPNYSGSQILSQHVGGDWDLEAKLRINRDAGCPNPMLQGVTIAVSKQPISYYWQVAPGDPNFDISWIAAITYSRYYPTNEEDAAVCVANNVIHGVNTEVCWFKLSKRGELIRGSYSLDGTNYSQEYSASYASAGYLSIYAYCNNNVYGSGYPLGPPPVITAGFDYIRIKPVGD